MVSMITMAYWITSKSRKKIIHLNVVSWWRWVSGNDMNVETKVLFKNIYYSCNSTKVYVTHLKANSNRKWNENCFEWKKKCSLTNSFRVRSDTMQIKILLVVIEKKVLTAIRLTTGNDWNDMKCQKQRFYLMAGSNLWMNWNLWWQSVGWFLFFIQNFLASCFNCCLYYLLMF